MSYLLSVYIPLNSVERVKKALFDAGAGKYENYDQCAWETQGKGQFRPLMGSNPTLGSRGNVENVDEIKLELICNKLDLKAIIQTLKKTHPYEEPAFHVIKLETVES